MLTTSPAHMNTAKINITPDKNNPVGMRRDGKKYGFRCVFAAECIPPEPQKPKNSNVIL